MRLSMPFAPVFAGLLAAACCTAAAIRDSPEAAGAHTSSNSMELAAEARDVGELHAITSRPSIATRTARVREECGSLRPRLFHRQSVDPPAQPDRASSISRPTDEARAMVQVGMVGARGRGERRLESRRRPLRVRRDAAAGGRRLESDLCEWNGRHAGRWKVSLARPHQQPGEAPASLLHRIDAMACLCNMAGIPRVVFNELAASRSMSAACAPPRLRESTQQNQ